MPSLASLSHPTAVSTLNILLLLNLLGFVVVALAIPPGAEVIRARKRQ